MRNFNLILQHPKLITKGIHQPLHCKYFKRSIRRIGGMSISGMFLIYPEATVFISGDLQKKTKVIG